MKIGPLVYYAPTLKILEVHIALGLSVCVCVGGGVSLHRQVYLISLQGLRSIKLRYQSEQ